MSFDRIVRDELSEVAQLRRDLEDLKSTVLARTSGVTYQWKSYTPFLSASTTNPTLGSGSSAEGRYVRLGTFVIYRFRIQFGSSGVNGGSGEYRISVPVPISVVAPAQDTFSMGSAVLFDWSVAGHKELAVCARQSADNIKLYVKNATVFHNNPFPWAADDRLGGTVFYQAS